MFVVTSCDAQSTMNFESEPIVFSVNTGHTQSCVNGVYFKNCSFV